MRSCKYASVSISFFSKSSSVAACSEEAFFWNTIMIYLMEYRVSHTSYLFLIMLCVEMAKIFLKKWKVWIKNVLNVRKICKNAISKIGLNYISNGSNMCLDPKFQVAMMFDGWRNREQTHHFLICVWKKHLKMP